MRIGSVCVVFCAAVIMAAVSACYLPPPDDTDFEACFPGDFEEVRSIIFDGLDSFRETSGNELLDNRIYDFQCIGPNSPPPLYGLSAVRDHTAILLGTGGSLNGRSLMLANKTAMNQWVKLDRVFTPGDLGRTFYISLWVYNESEQPISVRLGAFSLSGRIQATLYPENPIASSPAINIGSGWSEVVWAGYRHEDAQITQLGFSQAGGPLQERLFIDDIILKASP